MSPDQTKATFFTHYIDFLEKKSLGFTYFQGGQIIGATLSNELISNYTFENVKFIRCTGAILNDVKSNFINCAFLRCKFEYLKIHQNADPENQLLLEGCTIEALKIENSKGANITIEGGNYDVVELTELKATKISLKSVSISTALSINESEIFSFLISIPRVKIYFNQTTFRNGKFASHFTGLSITDCDFIHVLFERCRMDSISFTNCNFSKSPTQTVFDNCDLTTCAFDYCNIACKFLGKTFSNCRFGLNQYDNPIFDSVVFDGMKFHRQVFKGAQFSNCSLKKCDLTFAGIRGTKFTGCKLQESDFSGAAANSDTEFNDCTLNGMIIDRYSIASMQKEKIGSFTVANMMDMSIKDDLATLKLSFSGAFMWLHIWSLIIWLAPYIWYMVWLTTISKPNLNGKSEGEMYVIEKVWEFVKHGNQTGAGWEFIRLSIFFLLLIYNLNRLYLLVITKKLEMRSDFSGYPVNFSLKEPRVKLSWKINNWGIWISIVLVIINTILFLFRIVTK